MVHCTILVLFIFSQPESTHFICFSFFVLTSILTHSFTIGDIGFYVRLACACSVFSWRNLHPFWGLKVARESKRKSEWKKKRKNRLKWKLKKIYRRQLDYIYYRHRTYITWPKPRWWWRWWIMIRNPISSLLSWNAKVRVEEYLKANCEIRIRDHLSLLFRWNLMFSFRLKELINEILKIIRSSSFTGSSRPNCLCLEKCCNFLHCHLTLNKLQILFLSSYTNCVRWQMCERNSEIHCIGMSVCVCCVCPTDKKVSHLFSAKTRVCIHRLRKNLLSTKIKTKNQNKNHLAK